MSLLLALIVTYFAAKHALVAVAQYYLQSSSAAGLRHWWNANSHHLTHNVAHGILIFVIIGIPGILIIGGILKTVWDEWVR